MTIQEQIAAVRRVLMYWGNIGKAKQRSYRRLAEIEQEIEGIYDIQPPQLTGMPHGSQISDSTSRKAAKAIYKTADENDNELKELNERGHVPLPVIRESIKECIVPDVEKKLLNYDVLAGVLYMMGKTSSVVTEPELKRLITGLTGVGEEFYKAVDDFIANECKGDT